MPNHELTLIVHGGDLRAQRFAEALVEAGCNDATVSVIDDTNRIDFNREAASLGEAVLSAVRDVEKVEGLRVTRAVGLPQFLGQYLLAGGGTHDVTIKTPVPS